MKPLEAAGSPTPCPSATTTAGDGPRWRAGPAAHPDPGAEHLVFNSYFNAGRYSSVAGAYEYGKVDNIYSMYTAGGKKWMVLVLEMWPRKAVVEWAKNVVACHPNYNVIITTHSYLNGGSSIYQKSDYGDTSPQYLYDNLVKQYATSSSSSLATPASPPTASTPVCTATRSSPSSRRSTPTRPTRCG